MSNFKIKQITAFVPAKDFDLSERFYKDLGFIEVFKIENAIRLEIDGCSFWLQDYYVKDWVDNAMLCLYVDDLESWWANIKKLNMNQAYEGKSKILSKPHQQEDGLMMQFTDPSGVLWHVREER